MGDWTDTFFTGFWGELQRTAYSPEETRKQARFVRRALGLGKKSRVADIPCGDGRIAIELAAAGCEIVGVDRCEPSIRRARRRLKADGLRGEFRVGDMRSVRLDGRFDAVVNWYGSFGYYDDATNLAILAGFAGLIRPGGRVLVDQVNRERILRDFMRKGTFQYGSVKVTTENTWNENGQRIEGVWTLIRGGRRLRRRSSMRLYTPRQMERLMESAGLALDRLYGDTDGAPYTRGTRRMVSVGRRP